MRISGVYLDSLDIDKANKNEYNLILKSLIKILLVRS